MSTTVTMPQLGESVVEGTIGKWLVQEGERVTRDQPVVEILTDKADSEIPSPIAGIVVRLLAQEDTIVRVGEGLFVVDAAGAEGLSALDTPPAAPKSASSAASSVPSKVPTSPGAPKADAVTTARAATTATAHAAGPAGAHAAGPAGANAAVSAAAHPATTAVAHAPVAASPSVRKLAREQGLDLSTLTGRLTRDEVVKSQGAIARVGPVSAGPSAAVGKRSAFQVPAYVARPGDEVVPFSRRRRIIADHMVYSKQTSPHVVAVSECDLQATAKLRAGTKSQLKKEGVTLSYLAFICAATVRALGEYRELNARVLDDAYVLLREINLGVAVDTPDGLVVPVIKNADSLNVRGVARAIDELAERARSGKLTPDDLASKTFTVSNPGRRGNLHGGAIISQPNVGILRIGEIKKRVVVVENDGEDTMAIHPVMYLALSYDHRIVDGVNANGFLYRVTELLEQGDFEV